jgi:CBS-domain-containing membrane protein
MQIEKKKKKKKVKMCICCLYIAAMYNEACLHPTSAMYNVQVLLGSVNFLAFLVFFSS